MLTSGFFLRHSTVFPRRPRVEKFVFRIRLFEINRGGKKRSESTCTARFDSRRSKWSRAEGRSASKHHPPLYCQLIFYYGRCGANM